MEIIENNDVMIAVTGMELEGSVFLKYWRELNPVLVDHPKLNGFHKMFKFYNNNNHSEYFARYQNECKINLKPGVGV